MPHCSSPSGRRIKYPCREEVNVPEGIEMPETIDIVDTHFSDAEMKLFVSMLEHYRANQSMYIGDNFPLFSPAVLLDVVERFLAAYKTHTDATPVRTTDNFWISITRDGDGYNIKSANLYGGLSATILMAQGNSTTDEDYNKTLAGVRSNFKSKTVTKQQLARLQL